MNALTIGHHDDVGRYHRPLHRVVVVGAGFGGIAVTRGLRHAPVDVTLVERHNYTTFQPLLYQVATAGLNAGDVAHAVRGLFWRQPNATVVRGEAVDVDPARRHVHLADGRRLPYEDLVLAAGAAANTFGVPGAEEHALPLASLDDALAVRDHLLGWYEAAARDPGLVDAGALDVVVVGGGPTGVEVAGALSELVGTVLRRDFPDIDVRRARVVLVEMAPEVLGQFSPASRRHAAETLRARGVELRLGVKVAEVTAGRLVLAGGEILPARTVVWAAGVHAVPLAAALGFERGPGGRVRVDGHLRVPGHPEVYVVGDLAAAARDPTDPTAPLLPQLAPVAIQQGTHVAREIRAGLEGGSSAPFRYRDRGIMATIGRHAAVAELPGHIRLRGSLAWLAWLFLHLIMLIGFRNRLSVLVNWVWNYLTWDRGPRLILGGRERRAHRVVPDDRGGAAWHDDPSAGAPRGEHPTDPSPQR